jgi:hypothetical protein
MSIEKFFRPIFYGIVCWLRAGLLWQNIFAILVWAGK